MNKIYILIIIYIIFININLLTYTKSTYNTINNINPDKKKLIVVSHSYEHIDIFIIINECIKLKKNISILFSDKIWNHILKYYLYSIGVTWINFIFVTGGTVDKIKNKLKEESVIVYLYEYLDKTGIYYILEDKSISLQICSITSTHKPLNYIDNVSLLDIYLHNYNKHYTLKCSTYEYNINLPPKIFIKNLKKKLYPNL
jgi:hypothetical protein